MKHALVAAAAAVAVVLLAPGLSARAGSGGPAWNAAHLPSPAPGYLPRMTPAPTFVSAWNAVHVPSPAPGYLPRASRQPVQVVRVPASGFRFRDAGIGAAVATLALALLGAGLLAATRERGVRLGGS
jgi:hypothetical protein